MMRVSLFFAGWASIATSSYCLAGPCTDEIDKLTRALAARDGGAGPTAGTAGIAPKPQPNAPVGLTGSIDGGAALARARKMDDQGRETECMDAIRDAKRLSGAR